MRSVPIFGAVILTGNGKRQHPVFDGVFLAMSLVSMVKLACNRWDLGLWMGVEPD